MKVAVGTARRRSMDERERSIIAAHEVGHAICGRVHGDRRKVERDPANPAHLVTVRGLGYKLAR